jgi:prevent-host-death family protein
MTIVTASEAQARLSQLLASVAQGEEVLITDGGLPVARLIQPATQSPATLDLPARDRTLATDWDEEEDRPWRGVFAIESPGDPYPDGTLHFPSKPLIPEQQPADILWDRMDSIDD